VGKPKLDAADFLAGGVGTLQPELYFVKLVPLFGKLILKQSL